MSGTALAAGSSVREYSTNYCKHYFQNPWLYRSFPTLLPEDGAKGAGTFFVLSSDAICDVATEVLKELRKLTRYSTLTLHKQSNLDW